MKVKIESHTKRRLKTYSQTKKIPFYQNLKEYVDRLPVDDKIKDYIIEERFINDNPSYYAFYPFLFENVFKPKGDIVLLSIAGFLYYKSILTIDNIFDQEKFDSKLFFLSNFCQEEAVKILTCIFGLDSVFWDYWNKRKSEYSQALYIDKNLQNANSFEDFELLAEYKSSIGKVAIDALNIMSTEEDTHIYNNILNSHKYFYAGFQILDDIDDFTEDLEHNQFNFAFLKLKMYLSEENLDINNYTTLELNKLLYLSGVADNLLDRAIDYFDKSEKYVEKFQLNEWVKEIRRLNNVSISRKLNINAYIKNIKVGLIISKEKNSNSFPLKNSIEMGIRFIQNNQNYDGSWQEWYNDAGCSDSWATGFILSFICQKHSITKFNRITIKKAIDFLEKNSDNLWGYNKYWLPDADSTTFALLALITENEANIKFDVYKKWLKYQTPDFGFSTYNCKEELLASLDKEEDDNVNGWLSPHVCVSSSAFYYLSKAHPDSKEHTALKNFIINKINDKGTWDSYWWTSHIYSTAFLIKSSAHFKDSDFNLKIEIAISSVLQTQNQNGSFGDRYNLESAFYTSLIIDALCENRLLYTKYFANIKIAYKWLLENQLTDGSWHATPALRMPYPNVVQPDESKEWKEDTKGLNIRVSEFNRLFTTSLSISAITKFQAYAK